MKRLVLALAFVLVQLSGWNYSGHMVIAEIAKEQLSPKVRDEVDRLIRSHSMGDEQTNGFCECSCWADVVKGKSWKFYSSWHYINLAYDPDQVMDQEAKMIAKARLKDHNVVWAIRNSISVLKSSRSGEYEKALALRFLIHFVGDIHQPLHCVNGYSKANPRGDGGGYNVPVKDSRCKNLHQYWDRAAGSLPWVKFPITEGMQSKVCTLAADLQKRFPKGEFSQLKEKDPWNWALEGHQIATSFCYTTPRGKKISKEYEEKARLIAEEQMALAGYRLAQTLQEIFEK